MTYSKSNKVVIKETRPPIRGAVIRTVLNTVLIISDMMPVFGLPGSVIERLNVVSVIANRVGIKLPSLTPNVSNGILGAGIVGEVFDSVTLELLPFPSSIFIHGAQILHDIPKIHNYVAENPKYKKVEPFTRVLNNISLNLLKNRS